MAEAVVREVREAVIDALPAAGQLVLAVSGGVDSMVLLDAVSSHVPVDRLHVATFDHGTGVAASAAADAVLTRAAALGVAATVGRAASALAQRESAWRESRWAFLHQVGGSAATILTAHTRDDQVETVLFRVMRGSGTRGLAGLYARTEVVRPLVGVAKADVIAYAVERGLAWVEDPSNATTAFARNRVRLDLLPALRGVKPTIDQELIDIAGQAAQWRSEVEFLVDVAIDCDRRSDSAMDVMALSLSDFPVSSLGVIWPVLMAKVGVAMDWRGLQRLTEFTVAGKVGSTIQLSGGWTVRRRRECFEVRCGGQAHFQG